MIECGTPFQAGYSTSLGAHRLFVGRYSFCPALTYYPLNWAVNEQAQDELGEGDWTTRGSVGLDPKTVKCLLSGILFVGCLHQVKLCRCLHKLLTTLRCGIPTALNRPYGSPSLKFRGTSMVPTKWCGSFGLVVHMLTSW